VPFGSRRLRSLPFAPSPRRNNSVAAQPAGDRRHESLGDGDERTGEVSGDPCQDGPGGRGGDRSVRSARPGNRVRLRPLPAAGGSFSVPLPRGAPLCGRDVGLLRVYNTLQQGDMHNDVMPDLRELPDRQGRIKAPVTSDKLTGQTLDWFGKQFTII